MCKSNGHCIMVKKNILICAGYFISCLVICSFGISLLLSFTRNVVWNSNISINNFKIFIAVWIADHQYVVLYICMMQSLEQMTEGQDAPLWMFTESVLTSVQPFSAFYFKKWGYHTY